MPAPTSGVTDTADRLEEAVRDSHYLLAYFSRAKVNIAAEKLDGFKAAVTTLSSFRRDRSGTRATTSATTEAATASDGTTTESRNEVAAFWNAFIFLSDLAYPATIESIRYYFRFYYDAGKSDPSGETRNKHHLRFRKAQSSFFLLTVVALVMTISLSLLSYIGAQALVHYDTDYAHWSQVQSLVRYLDEGGKAIFTGDQTSDGRRLVIKLPSAITSAQSDQITPTGGRSNLTNSVAAPEPISDIFLQVPTA